MGAGGLDQPLGAVGEGALIEQGGHGGKHDPEMALPAFPRNLAADDLHPSLQPFVNHTVQRATR